MLENTGCYGQHRVIVISFSVMNHPILQLSGEPIGTGQERVCYRHPAELGKAVKIQKGKIEKQTRRELSFYRWLQRRNMINFRHLRRFFGQVETNLGPGFVVDLISDYGSTVSRSLLWHFEQGYSVHEFTPLPRRAQVLPD
jgi:hypothetical protein